MYVSDTSARSATHEQIAPEHARPPEHSGPLAGGQHEAPSWPQATPHSRGEISASQASPASHSDPRQQGSFGPPHAQRPEALHVKFAAQVLPVQQI
jgi:hypothetical protein